MLILLFYCTDVFEQLYDSFIDWLKNDKNMKNNILS